MEYSRESVLDSYRRTGSLRSACVDTGCPPYVAFIWLRKAGVLSSGDKASYGSANSKRGAAAEREFQRLVPCAMPSNEQLQANCPSFDFDVGGLLVDVKVSHKRSDGTWGWRMAGKSKALRPDFYCVFLVEGSELNQGYSVLLIPDAIFPEMSQPRLSPENRESTWWDFEIAPEHLERVLSDESK